MTSMESFSAEKMLSPRRGYVLSHVLKVVVL